jgi:hypothetical protein
LYDGARSMGSVVVGPAGTWTITVSLAIGTHSLSATQAAGVLVSSGSAAATVAVLGPPAAPAISLGGTNLTSPAAISGIGGAGDIVTLYDGAAAIGTTTASATGAWTLTVALSVGRHTLTATQWDPATSLISVASAAVVVTVYPNAPNITAVTAPAPTYTSSIVTVSGTGDPGDAITLYDGGHLIAGATVSAGGAWSVTVTLAIGPHSLWATQAAGVLVSGASIAVGVTVAGPPPAPSLSLTSTNLSALAVIAGSGVAGDTLTLYDGATAIGTVKVGSAGTWSMTVTLALGKHTLSAAQTDATTGLVSVKSAAVTVTVYAVQPPPVIKSAAEFLTTGWVNVAGTGVAGDTIALFDGATAVATVTIAANGTWSLWVQLARGTRTLTATQSVAPGVTGAASGPFSVTVR